MEIRRAVVADARGAAAAQRAGWQVAYAGLVPAARLAAMDLDVMTSRWEELLTAGESTTFVSVACGEVTGFITVGQSRDGDFAGAEVRAIYLRPDAWGSGAGQELLTAGLAEVNDVPVMLWVLSANARARRFYGRNGFLADGVEKDYPAGGDVVLPEVRLVLARDHRRP